MAVAVVLAAPVAAVGLAEAALFVLGVAIASAAFFFVGIVAFRSVDTVAFVAAVLVDLETAAAFCDGLVAAVGLDAAPFRAALGATAALVPAVALLVVALVAVALVAVVLLTVVLGALLVADLLVADLLLAGLAFSTLGAVERVLGPAGLFAAVRVRAVVAGLVARAAVVAWVAFARFTEAAGCAALRAAALDAATGLAVRADDFGAAFAFEADGLVEADFVAGGLAAPDLAAPDLAAVDLAATGFRTTVLAALRSRAAGLVLGDMSATPEIGRSPGA